MVPLGYPSCFACVLIETLLEGFVIPWEFSFISCFPWPDPRQAIRATFTNTERGALLTTHYMAEAEAVCDRVAIMVSGRLRWVLVRPAFDSRLPSVIKEHCPWWQAGESVPVSAWPCPRHPATELWWPEIALSPCYTLASSYLSPGVLALSNIWKANLAKITCWRWRWRPSPKWSSSTRRSWSFSPRLLGRKGNTSELF